MFFLISLPHITYQVAPLPCALSLLSRFPLSFFRSIRARKPRVLLAVRQSQETKPTALYPIFENKEEVNGSISRSSEQGNHREILRSSEEQESQRLYFPLLSESNLRPRKPTAHQMNKKANGSIPRSYLRATSEQGSQEVHGVFVWLPPPVSERAQRHSFRRAKPNAQGGMVGGPAPPLR